MHAIVQASAVEGWKDKFGARVACVISNRPDAEGLSTATALGVACEVVDHKLFVGRAAFDAALAERLDAYQPALVVLAGFMRILTPEFVARYAGRLINIHPSLLPAFTGLNTHQRAIDAGCKVAGATVHRVTAELDYGTTLAQVEVPVLPNDTAASLAARVLLEEHLLYPQAIKTLLSQMQHDESGLNPN